MASKRSKECVERDVRDNSPEDKPKKKVKRQQTFIAKYTETWPFMRRGKVDTFVFCEICACEFSISSGGSDEISRHIGTEKHKKNTKIREAQKSNSKITGFFQSAQLSKNDNLEVTKAETMMVDLVTELNLPMAALDKINKGVKKMFPDSEIAQKFQCGRSKGTAIIKDIAAKTTLTLGERMKKQPFTISTDGSNDKGGEKLFPLVVRTVDPETMEVRSGALAVPTIEGSATGENIFKLIKAEFEAHRIPWDNCLALGSDNAHVMVGADKGVYGCMLKEHPKLYLSGCVCHLIHISAEKGASCLPLDVGQLLIDVYYYMDKSSKRLTAFKCMQVLHNLKEAKILKHVHTRWLSIGKCLPGFIESWEALFDFFKAEEVSATDSVAKKKAADLKKKFQSPTNKLYCIFLADITKVFDEVNTKLQAEEPLVHMLKDSLHAFLRKLLIRFVKPSAMQFKLVTDVDFKSKYNIKEKSDIIIGEEAHTFIAEAKKHHLRPERIEEFYDSIQNFFKVSCTYLLKKLPLSDELLQHAEVVSPRKQTDSRFSSLNYFLERFPKLKPEGATLTDIQLEFARYQCADIRQCVANTDRVDETWKEISKLMEDGELIFKYLPTVMLTILTIPHSSAHCERIFSVVRKNRTEFRGSMGCDTLEALVVAKSRPGSALDRTYSNDQLRELKSAYYHSLQKQD